jgi:hypothetical protein
LLLVQNGFFRSFSPDGSEVAYGRSHLEEFIGTCSDLGVVGIDGTDDNLLIDDSLHFQFHGWTSDSSRVFATDQEGRDLFMDPEGGSWEDISLPGSHARIEPHSKDIDLPALPPASTPVAFTDHICNA